MSPQPTAESSFSGTFDVLMELSVRTPMVCTHLLLFYGSILGQFKFFWEFEKRMFQRIANIFR
jgi:hypothetical protein